MRHLLSGLSVAHASHQDIAYITAQGKCKSSSVVRYIITQKHGLQIRTNVPITGGGFFGFKKPVANLRVQLT